MSDNKINYGDRYPILSKKLKDKGYNEKKIKEICDILDNVCKNCWETDFDIEKHCYCMCDD
jgi:broad-specificity NMP kinase